MAYQLYKGDKPLATFVPQIADDLTTDDSTKALSAKQGKVLNDTKVGLTAEVITITTGTTQYNGFYYGGSGTLSDQSNIISIFPYKKNTYNDPVIAQITSTGSLRVYTHSASQEIQIKVVRSYPEPTGV